MRLLWILLVILGLVVTVNAAVKVEDIEYSVGATRLKGVLAFDDARREKVPGVVIFPEWWGVNDYTRMRARMFAEMGYVALVADMYGDGHATVNPEEAGKLAGGVYGDPQMMLARANAAIEALRGGGRVQSEKIAAVGYCFGGNVALNLAYSGADLRAVVGFHTGMTNRIGRLKPIRAKVLVCNGSEDKLISREEFDGFEKAMREGKADWQYVIYGGAMHSFTNPGADQFKSLGTVGYNREADLRSWQLTRLFLADAFQ